MTAVKQLPAICVYDEYGNLETFVLRDEKSGKTVFYTVEEMTYQDVADFLEDKVVYKDKESTEDTR